jgi:hypothetical protein
VISSTLLKPRLARRGAVLRALGRGGLAQPARRAARVCAALRHAQQQRRSRAHRGRVQGAWAGRGVSSIGGSLQCTRGFNRLLTMQ